MSNSHSNTGKDLSKQNNSIKSKNKQDTLEILEKLKQTLSRKLSLRDSITASREIDWVIKKIGEQQ